MSRTDLAPEALFVQPRLDRTFRPEREPDPLLERLAAVVEQSTLSLLDPDRIQAMAEDMVVIRLKRVHHMGLLVSSLVLSALERQSDTSGRWLDAQTVYKQIGGPRSGKTSFRNKTRQVIPVMQEMLNRRMKELTEKTDDFELRGRLKAFSNVLIPDGCAFKLASVLSGYFPGTGNPAELKLHAIYCVKTGLAEVVPTAGRVHDNDKFTPATWERGALYIWDLGYNDTGRFIDAARAGAVPLQRLKNDANPMVLAWWDEEGTRHPVAYEDGKPMRLTEASQLDELAEGAFDLDVELRDANGRREVARVVCVPFDREDRYYLTTLPRDIFTPFDVAELYRIRWEVELFFRNWHGALRMDDVHRLRHADSVQAHVSASLLAAALARDIHAGLTRLSAQGTDAPFQSVAIPP
jgi:putative transposase